MYCCRRKFSASNGWMDRFLHVNKLSVVKARTVRRPIITDKESKYISLFLVTIKVVFEQYEPRFIINMDEMNIGKGDSHIQVIGHRNRGYRKVKTTYANKTSLTCCFAIAYDGTKLKPMFTKKGKTTRSLKSLTINASKEVGCVTESGWSTPASMLFYIRNVIIPYTQNAPTCLIWDVHASHKTAEVNH